MPNTGRRVVYIRQFLAVPGDEYYCLNKLGVHMAAAEQLSITLPAEMVRVIREKVGTGDYGSNSEVIREALRGWIEREQRLVSLDAAIARGIADAGCL